MGIVVQDMATSLAFYRRLGFDLPAKADGEPHVEYELAGGLKVAWDTVATVESFTPGYHRPKESGIGLAFECDSPAEVDNSYDTLVAAGAVGERKPWDAFWGMRYASLLDPDGYGIDLFANLSG
ncbi:VOC family protein [Fodinicola feengrottensis]|uniref:VOC family protein n=1 Tax=Fodinicola feengrottensis TaxID=435914 RepID=A0ABP4TNI8_9ACTN